MARDFVNFFVDNATPIRHFNNRRKGCDPITILQGGCLMLVQSESKAQNWRAVAVLDGRGECLLYVGRSTTQIRSGYVDAFNELLDEEEKNLCSAIHMQQWTGTPDAGRWATKTELRVPIVSPEKAVKVA